uniref:Spike glycoprotein n=1 Tax=Rhinolophus bat coronavirus HKU2 TaxID=693998 RepID=A8JP00_9ALPC|nr:spike glycoprotein [Rhinolophus bat coronavirus HKU2]
MKLFIVFVLLFRVCYCCDYVDFRLFNGIFSTSRGLSNTTTVITGAYPSTNKAKWFCPTNVGRPVGTGVGIGVYAQTAQASYETGGSGAGGYTFSVSPKHVTNLTWSLWVHRPWGANANVTVRLCRWWQKFSFNETAHFQPAGPSSAFECLVNGSFPSSQHKGYMFGVTWYNDFVRIIFPPTVFELQVDGLQWEYVQFTGPVNAGRMTKFNVVTEISSVLVLTDQSGAVTRYSYCADGFVNGLQCKLRLFDIPPGVYSNSEVEYPVALYTVVHNMSVCPQRPESYCGSNYCPFKRVVFSNCVVNYTSWTSGLLRDYQHLVLPNGKFNPFTECNGLNRIVDDCVTGFVLRVGRGTAVNRTVITPYLKPNECFGWSWNDYQDSIYDWWIADFVSTGAFVCEKNPDAPRTGVCITYTIEKVTFQGVLYESNFTFAQYYNVLYFGSQLKYVRILGKVYEVAPCFEASYDVLFRSSSSFGLLYRSFDCNQLRISASRFAERLLPSHNGTATALGCLFNATYAPNDTMVNCTNPLGDGFCADLLSNVVVRRMTFEKHDTTYVAPVTIERFTELPLDHQLVLTEQFLQTTMPKFSISCETYICDVSKACKNLLFRYGGFCQKIEADIRGAGVLLDSDVSGLYSTIAAKTSSIMPTTDRFNVSQFFLPKVQSTSERFESRSVIEDLLFSKIETTGPGFYGDYYNCKKNAIQDLTCAQYHNGILVIPPVMDAETLGMYGGIAAASLTLGIFGGQAGITTWSLAMAGRLNALGVVQNALVDDVNKLANGFNQLTASVSKLALTTSSALQAIQAVVNQNAAQVESLVSGITENFGAISTNFKVISQRLDKLEADVQMDRLINGRMNVLQLFVTNYKLKIAELRNTHRYVQSLINECVYAQSLRNGFCGQGLHVLSLMQNAPSGIMFFHYSLIPNNTIIVKTTPGLCESDELGSKCIVAKDGVLVSANLSYWQWSPRNLYKPENLTFANVIAVSRGANYTTLNRTFDIPELNNTFPIEEEFREYFQNMSSELQALKNLTADMSKLNISAEIQLINEIAHNVSNMRVEVEKFQRYVNYVKWAWWQWLIIFIALTLLAGLMLWCCLATGCCGMCGCLAATCASCCDCRGTKLQSYEIEKVHIQ